MLQGTGHARQAVGEGLGTEGHAAGISVGTSTIQTIQYQKYPLVGLKHLGSLVRCAGILGHTRVVKGVLSVIISAVKNTRLEQ